MSWFTRSQNVCDLMWLAGVEIWIRGVRICRDVLNQSDTFQYDESKRQYQSDTTYIVQPHCYTSIALQIIINKTDFLKLIIINHVLI